MRLVLALLLVGGGAAAYFAFGRGEAGPPAEAPPQGTPGVKTDSSYLDEAKRLELFDLERADLMLNHALKPWTGAIRMRDEAGIRSALAADFEGEAPIVPPKAEKRFAGGRPYGFAKLEAGTALDADGFTRWLLDVAGRFERIDTVSFARKYNSPNITQGPGVVADSRGVWRIAGTRPGNAPLELSGTFELRHKGMASGVEVPADWIHGMKLGGARLVQAAEPFFREITAESGIDVAILRDNWRDRDPRGSPVFTGGVYLGDANEDGHLDVVVTERGRAWLYLGRGDGVFQDSGWRPPVPGPYALTYAAIFDATCDGHPNIVFAGTIYRWDEGRRIPVPVPAATQLPNCDMSLCDFDRDGRTDVYLLEGGRALPPSKTRAFFDDERVTGHENLLYRNLGGGQFENVTAKANASGGMGRTFGATWLYANDDLWPDVFCANEFGRNAFLINKGDGTFEEAEDIDKTFGGFSMGIVSGDLDGDGLTDIYVSNMYSKAGHRVYHHLDMSLYPDNVRRMFMASVDGNKYYTAKGDLTFEDEGASAGVNAVGWGWSGAIADFDLDGWLDLYAPCGHTSADRTKPDG